MAGKRSKKKKKKRFVRKNTGAQLAGTCTQAVKRTVLEAPENENTGLRDGPSGIPHSAFWKATWQGVTKNLKYRYSQGP